MRISTALRAFAFAAAATLLAACEYSPSTVDRTIAFNRSVAESTNQLILLNAIRASKRNPTYYSRIATDTTQSTVTPSLTGAIPWIGGKSIASSNLTAPATVTTTLTRAIPALTSGLSITEQNQLSLSNLDDQGSINGLMTPVPTQVYQYFQSEGFNKEELFMMFMGSIQLNASQMAKIAELARDDCAKIDSLPPNPWCKSLTDSPANPVIESRCYSGADPVATPQRAIFFANDPALYRSAFAGSTREFRDFECFQQIERALLALGLHPETSSSFKALYRIPLEYVKGNPRYLADLNQQGLDVVVMPATSSGALAYLGVCKKTDTALFQVDEKIETLLKAEATQMPHQARGARGKDTVQADAQTRPDNSGLLTFQFGPQFVNTTTPNGNSSTQPSAPPPQAAGPTSCKTAIANLEKSDRDEGTKSPSEKIAVPDKKPAPIVFGQRSLEAMVYYIGQVIRRKVELREPSQVLFLNGADAGKPYYEELFDIQTGLPPEEAIVQVASGGETYYVPSICNQDDCSAVEYPTHASPQILTLLNQIWGLEKTATALPAVSNVTVVNPQ